MLTLLFSTALAASNEVGLSIGWLDSGDPAWRHVAESGAYATWGGHFGLAVHDRVTVLAGYRHGRVGADLDAWDWDSDESSSSFNSAKNAFYANTFLLGAKADWEVVESFTPYLGLQAQGLLGMARVDDELDDDENVSQRQQVGFSPGFVVTGGLAFPVPTAVDGMYVTPWVDAGYGWVAPLKLGDLGRVQPSGFTGQAGVAFQF